MMQPTPSDVTPDRIACNATDSFAAWLASARGTVAISTYQAGKLAFVGWDGRQVSLMMRHFDKPLGLAIDRERMALVTRHELLFFANAPLLAHAYLEDQPGRYDALYLPRASYFTGDLHAHDLAYSRDGLLMVNTRFSCLAGLSKDFSFVPLWRPKFVSDLVPEDRCHLNGLALRDGKPAWVTALGETDTAGGWRDNKAAGGILIDVESGEIISRGLCMPHSPRWYNNMLWVLNSGEGELCLVDPANGERQTVCRLPGYLRGLSFLGPYALIGMSKVREKHIFGGLPIQQRHEQLHCGVAVVDLRSGTHVGNFEFTAGCTELYDVQFLPGIMRPTILNAQQEAVRQAVTNPDSSYWLRPSAEVKEAPSATDATPAGEVEGNANAMALPVLAAEASAAT
ncbi:MAG: TIGR03032 family protein [Pirellulales bacterium]|nr:TIGR03032 family protein [Pirellulales bacterium]